MEAFRSTNKELSGDEWSDSDGSISTGQSGQSEDLEDAAMDASSESESSEEDRDKVLVGDLGSAEEEILNKGQRRRLLAAAKAISEAASREIEEKKAYKAQAEPVPRSLKQRWKILEVFTWSCMVSTMAYQAGWEFCEPITLPNWNLVRTGRHNWLLWSISSEFNLTCSWLHGRVHHGHHSNISIRRRRAREGSSWKSEVSAEERF